ncbi:MAG: putative hydrolase [Rhodospirillaceae bacterium]|nr:MAG: putative hydrolase [Rhodospirillaceae bacterium]
MHECLTRRTVVGGGLLAALAGGCGHGVTSARGAVLCYHDIADVPYTLWCRTPEILEEDFRLLRSSPIAILPLDTYVDSFVSRRPLPERWAVITFDDATAGQFRHARSLLRKFGFSATFYVPTQWVVDRRGEFPDSEPAMSIDQLRLMISDGHQIAPHSNTHPRFTELDDEKVRHEIETSVRFLFDHFGVRSRDFCLPYGLYLPRHEALLLEAGMRSVALTGTDHGPGASALVKVRRFEVLQTMTSAHVLQNFL